MLLNITHSARSEEDDDLDKVFCLHHNYDFFLYEVEDKKKSLQLLNIN